MDAYKTVEEKAAEWDMSSRHIQYLCRNGRIEGAQKHAGVWFIPCGAPSPAKNSKHGGRGPHFTGTKKEIFYSAIELFKSNGFDSVSLRDIAIRVGIRQSTIYNHFKSKQEILDAIFEFFRYHFLKERPALEDMRERLKHEDPLSILLSIRYWFKNEHMQTMSDIAKIVFQRIGIDEQARLLSRQLMLDEGIHYVESVFNMGIEDGHLEPFDTHAMSVFINSVRIFTLYIWILDLPPDDMQAFLRDEERLYEYASALIKARG